MHVSCLLQIWNPRCNFYKEGIPTTNHTAPKCYKMGFGFNIPIKNQKKCYYKITIGYGPSAVCYKIATDPNLKTSNWLKTAGCTYHKSTHSVVEIRTGIPTLFLYIFIMFYLFSVFLKQCSHTEGLLWQVLGLRKSRCSFEVETYVCGIVTTFTAQKNMFNASLARNGSPRTSFPKILALMMQWLFWKMEFQTRTRKCYAGCTRINWKCWRLAVTTLFLKTNRGVIQVFVSLRMLINSGAEQAGTNLRNHMAYTLVRPTVSRFLTYVCFAIMQTYANEFVLFAKSWRELVEMLEFMGGLEPFSRGVRRVTGKTTFASHRNKNLADLSRNGRTNWVNFVKGTSDVSFVWWMEAARTPE